YSKNTTKLLYSQRVIGGSPTGLTRDCGSPKFASTRACDIPRVGLPDSSNREAESVPRMSSVSAPAMPAKPPTRATSAITLSLDMYSLPNRQRGDYSTGYTFKELSLRHRDGSELIRCRH